jgi:hypothetical protein
MAAATKSIDTDFLSLRTVYTKNAGNQNISSTKVLATDGEGGTFWAAPQTLGALPTFNLVETSAGSYAATETNRTLRLLFGDGLAMYSSTLYATNLSYIDVSGATSIHSSKVNIIPSGFISAYTDTATNTVFLSSVATAPALSTGDLYFQQLKIISSVQSPLNTNEFGGNSVFSGTAYDSYTTLAGVGSLTLTSFTTTKEVFVSIYPYTAAGYLSMKNNMGSMFISTMSTISSLYITVKQFSTGMESISTTESLNYSTNVSTLLHLSNETNIRYLNTVGNTLARAYITQLTTQFNTLNTGLSTISSTKLQISELLATTAAFYLNSGSRVVSTLSTLVDPNVQLYDFKVSTLRMFSTQLSTLSTSLATNLQTMSNKLITTFNSYFTSTNSTFTQLGSFAYLSSTTISNSPYVLKSTLVGSLQSTVVSMIQTAPYISSLSLKSTLQSTVAGISFVLPMYIQSIQSTTQGIIDYGGYNSYVSSISTLQPENYVSNQSVTSTMNAVFSRTSTISTLSYVSTFAGLGNIYASTLKIPGCFRSSFGVSPFGTGSIIYNNDNTNPLYQTYSDIYGYSFNVYINNTNVNITSMSSFILPTSKVQIDFNVSFYLQTDSGRKNGNQYQYKDRLVPISSFIQYTYNDTNHIIGTFSETMNVPYDYAQPLTPQYATYNKRISFIFSGNDIISSYVSNSLILSHKIEFAIGNVAAQATANVISRPSPTNSIFVSIYN